MWLKRSVQVTCLSRSQGHEASRPSRKRGEHQWIDERQSGDTASRLFYIQSTGPIQQATTVLGEHFNRRTLSRWPFESTWMWTVHSHEVPLLSVEPCSLEGSSSSPANNRFVTRQHCVISCETIYRLTFLKYQMKTFLKDKIWNYTEMITRDWTYAHRLRMSLCSRNSWSRWQLNCFKSWEEEMKDLSFPLHPCYLVAQ